MENKFIRSKKTQRVFRVLQQQGLNEDARFLVQLVHSPKEEHPSVHEPFWLEHEEWEVVDHPSCSVGATLS